MPKYRKTLRKRKWQGLLGRPSPARTADDTLAQYAARWGIPDDRARRWTVAYDNKLIRELYAHYKIEHEVPDKGTRKLILALAKDAGVPALQNVKKRRGRPITSPRVEILLCVDAMKKMWPNAPPKSICRQLAGKHPLFKKFSAVTLYDTYKKAKKDYDAITIHFMLLIGARKELEHDRQIARAYLEKGEPVPLLDEQGSGSEIE